MNLHPQPHATAEISAIPTLFAEGVVWEPSLDPRFRLFSIPEENQLDQSLGRHLSKPTLHDTTIARNLAWIRGSGCFRYLKKISWIKALVDISVNLPFMIRLLQQKILWRTRNLSTFVFYFFPFPLDLQMNWPSLQIEFEKGDQRDPINFSRRKKWAITAVACFGTYTVCKVISLKLSLKNLIDCKQRLPHQSITWDFHQWYVTSIVRNSKRPLAWVYTRSVLVWSLLWRHLSVKSLDVNRYTLDPGSGFYSWLSWLHCTSNSILLWSCDSLWIFARSKNIQTVIVARFLQGAFGSTGSTMVGGTISDIWSSKEYVSR